MRDTPRKWRSYNHAARTSVPLVGPVPGNGRPAGLKSPGRQLAERARGIYITGAEIVVIDATSSGSLHVCPVPRAEPVVDHLRRPMDGFLLRACPGRND